MTSPFQFFNRKCVGVLKNTPRLGPHRLGSFYDNVIPFFSFVVIFFIFLISLNFLHFASFFIFHFPLFLSFFLCFSLSSCFFISPLHPGPPWGHPAPSFPFLKHRFSYKNSHFKARIWVREEEERADRNRSFSTIARTGTFCFSRAWEPLTPIILEVLSIYIYIYLKTDDN